MLEPIEPKPSIWTSLAGFAIFSGVVLVVWVAAFFFYPWYYGKPENVGVAGDMFGGITALFSGLAFAGLISTLLMQRQELELQRGELRQSREEFSLQRFENTFFGLVKILNEHVGSISIDPNAGKFYSIVSTKPAPSFKLGRAALRLMASWLPEATIELQTPNPSKPDENIDEKVDRSLAEISELYVELYDKKLESDLGPYFRILFNLFRHIEESGFSEDDKKKYARIARAYLSSAEVKLLMFNCASHLGKDFKPWVEKYSLLKHIHPKDEKENPQVFASYDGDASKNRKFD